MLVSGLLPLKCRTAPEVSHSAERVESLRNSPLTSNSPPPPAATTPLVPGRKLVKWLRPPQAENVPLSRKSPAKRTSAPTTRTVPPGELVNNPVTVGIVAAAAATIPAGVGAGGGP